MGGVLKSVKPLPDYRLELAFQNGSTAVINMEKRVKTLRFSRLAFETVFVTARADGDRVAGAREKRISASIASSCLTL